MSKNYPPANNRARSMASHEHFTQMLLQHESTSDKNERALILRRLKDERRMTLLQAIECENPKNVIYLESQFRQIRRVLFTITEDQKVIQGVLGLQ